MNKLEVAVFSFLFGIACHDEIMCKLMQVKMWTLKKSDETNKRRNNKR